MKQRGNVFFTITITTLENELSRTNSKTQQLYKAIFFCESGKICLLAKMLIV